MIKNEKVKKAEQEFEYLTGDEETKRLAYLREKAIRDELAVKAQAKKEGREESRKRIAKKMLEKNKPIEEIMEFTELTKEEIEKL